MTPKLTLTIFFGLMLASCGQTVKTSSFLDRLSKNNDTLFLKYEMEGCYSGRRELCKIFKSDSYFTISRTQSYSSRFDSIAVVKMTPLSVSSFDSLESKISSFVDSKQYYCTSTDSFTLTFKSDTLKATDYDCVLKPYYHNFIELTFQPSTD